MKTYKKQIAILFALLFIGAQTNDVFHSFLTDHSHFVASASGDQDNFTEKTEFSTVNFSDCISCHHVHYGKYFQLAKNNFKNTVVSLVQYKNGVFYKIPVFSQFLLNNTSLRAPPVLVG